MNPIVLILIILLLCGGWGYHGGYLNNYSGSGLGLVLIVLLVLALTGRI